MVTKSNSISAFHTEIIMIQSSIQSNEQLKQQMMYLFKRRVHVCYQLYHEIHMNI